MKISLGKKRKTNNFPPPVVTIHFHIFGGNFSLSYVSITWHNSMLGKTFWDENILVCLSLSRQQGVHGECINSSWIPCIFSFTTLSEDFDSYWSPPSKANPDSLQNRYLSESNKISLLPYISTGSEVPHMPSIVSTCGLRKKEWVQDLGSELHLGTKQDITNLFLFL